jgi:coenzyme F420 biosynthesis associated uncharacterized protein
MSNDATFDWTDGAPAAPLVDWGVASGVGRRLSGGGGATPGIERARLSEDFAEVVEEAQALVTDYTDLTISGYRSRAWVQTRGEWIDANLRAFQRVLDPFAERILARRQEGAVAATRRKVLGTQVGILTGYLSRRVLGQYDLFLPPDDDGLLYFVGRNVLALERRFGFQPRDFRLWLALHEVAHRVQFGAVTWLRPHMMSLIDAYLTGIDLDPRRLLESLRRAASEARRSREWRGLGILFLLMTPEQQETFRRMQAVMSLLEGHANHVMNVLAEGRIREFSRMRTNLRERRRRASGVEKAFQRAIGFETKVAQYDTGERFVTQVVDQGGMAALNRVWEDPRNLPTLQEIARPERWLGRVDPAPS